MIEVLLWKRAHLDFPRTGYTILSRYGRSEMLDSLWVEPLNLGEKLWEFVIEGGMEGRIKMPDCRKNLTLLLLLLLSCRTWELPRGYSNLDRADRRCCLYNSL